jgi:hypothetical protein
MLFYAEKNHCLYACQSSWDDKATVMRIPVGAAGHVDGEHYPTNYTPRKMQSLAYKAEMLDLDREIEVDDVAYRLDLQNLRIKHLAQAAKTTAATSGKAAKGQLSWQTFKKFTILGDLAYAWYELSEQATDWQRLRPYEIPRDINAENGWTCPECGAVNDANSGECDCGTTYDGPVGEIETRPDDSAPGEQESGETLEGEILPPEEEPTSAVQKATTGTLSGLDKITAIIHDDLDEINQLEEQAVNRAIRVGIMQEMAKRLLPHGEFTAWREREFPLTIRMLQYYHLLALKRLAEVGLLKGHDKGTPMQIPLPRDLAGLTTDTLIPEKYSQQVFEWGGNAPASINEALARYGVKKLDYKRRGGDHGGGAASHERSMNRHQIELELAIDEWRQIIKQFRDFAIARNRSPLVPGPMLEEGMKSIKDCMRQVEQVIQKG